MEELKLLIEMVAHLPAMALWVLVGFFAYKVIIVGSLYGVIRYGIWALHSWLTTPKETSKVEKVNLYGMLHGLCITQDNVHETLIGQLMRVRGKGTGINSTYIHSQSVGWMRQASDDKIAKDVASEQQKKAA